MFIWNHPSGIFKKEVVSMISILNGLESASIVLNLIVATLDFLSLATDGGSV